MSVGEFIRIFFEEGLSQPFFPEELGMFGYPIWGMLFISCLALLTQQATEPRTTKQKRIRFLIFSMFLFAIIWGLVQAWFYTVEVM